MANGTSEMNPYQVMIRVLGQRINRDEVDVVLHAGEFGPLVISQVVTSREHSFVFIRAGDGRLFSFHVDVISGFPIEVRPKASQSGERARPIGFMPASPTDDATDFEGRRTAL